MTVHNDFHETHGLFRLFDGLSVNNMDKPQHPVNGDGSRGSNLPFRTKVDGNAKHDRSN